MPDISLDKIQINAKGAEVLTVSNVAPDTNVIVTFVGGEQVLSATITDGELLLTVDEKGTYLLEMFWKSFTTPEGEALIGMGGEFIRRRIFYAV